MFLGHLVPIAPYDFEMLLALLRRFPHQTTARVHDHSVRRVCRVGRALVLIQAEADGQAIAIRALATDGEFDSAVAFDVSAHIFQINHRRADFRVALADHPTLSNALSPVIGMPLLRAPDLFEPLMCAVIEQQISWRVALKAQRWLMDWAGEGVSYQGDWWAAFPSPTRLVAASHEELLPLKITHKRINLVRSIAQAVIDGTLDLDSMANLDELTQIRALTTLKGVGTWTAAVALSRAYGAGATIPTNDVALQAAAYFYINGRDGRYTPDELGSVLGVLGEWGGLTAELLLSRWVIERY
jgi:DNA-3-methyladenine glycosylase II